MEDDPRSPQPVPGSPEIPQEETLDAEGADTPSDPSRETAEELNGVRIRQLSALRRSTYRARSFAIVFSAGGFVVAIKLLLMTLASFRYSGVGAWSLGLLLFAILALVVGFHFASRATELHREANQPMPMPPAPPGGPDFSTLSDGSQQWKNLEDIR